VKQNQEDSPRTNKQTNKQTLYDIHTYIHTRNLKVRLVKSVAFYPHEFEMLVLFDELRARDRTDFSTLNKQAMIEYINRHHPGNPQLPLTKFTKPTPKVEKPPTQTIVHKPRRDYSKLSTEKLHELQNKYRQAHTDHTFDLTLIAFELKKRSHKK